MTFSCYFFVFITIIEYFILINNITYSGYPYPNVMYTI